MVYHKPQEVLAALAHAYYEERDIDAVLACMTDDVAWVGIEKGNRANGKPELRKLLEAELSTFSRGVRFEPGEPTIQTLGPKAAVITLEAELYPAEGAEGGVFVRGTLCCVETEQGWLVSNGHTSFPNDEIEKMLLQNALEEEREKQKALLDNVPGGIAMYRLKKDGRIAAEYVSDGLAKICGYEDSADIMKVIGEDSRKIILPEDLSFAAEACETALSQGIPSGMQIRVTGKDGKPVNLTLDSVMMKNAKLGPEDAAVIYAVETLVSEETIKKAEEQQKRLSLLNTVPAGIGVFELNKDGITQNYMNDAFYRLIGARREDRTQYTGKNVFAATHPKDIAKLEDAVTRLIGGQDFIQLDYRIMGGSGTWVWLHLTAAVVERNTDYVKLHAAYYECTESKRQQLKLLQNQKAATLAQQQGRISVWTFNMDKKIIEQQTPPEETGYMGYPSYLTNVPQCLVETDSIHPEDVEKFLSAYEKLEAGAEKSDVLYRLKDRGTGVYNWVHIYYQRSEDSEDGERMAVGFSIQVNAQQAAIERYRMEQKLREQLYANAVVYLEYNLTKRKYEGKNNTIDWYPPEQWEAKSREEYREKMSAIVDERYLEEMVEKLYADSLQRAFDEGKNTVSCEFRSREQPGRPSRWYRIAYSMVKRPDTGDVMAFVCVEDIEAEKTKQMAIECSTSDGIEVISLIHVADARGRLVRSKNAVPPGGLEKNFSYDEAFVRRSIAGAVPEDRELSYHSALLSTVLKELETKEIYQYSISTKLGEGALKRILIRFRYLDDRKNYVVLSVSNITAVYLKEQEKNKILEAALAEANAANHEKTNFLSRVSHDMRTPLNGILGLTTLLKDTVTDQEVLRDLDELEMSGRYLLDLINDTLDVSRIESGNLELHPVVYDGRKMFNNAIRLGKLSIKARNIAFNVHTPNTPFTLLYVDVSRVEQIFMNIFGNAAKFTPDGGTIDFTMTNLSVENGVITNKLVISDTGVGMSPEFLPHIFEAFTQADASKTSTAKGTGLGMAITKQLIERMGGSVSVESELGKGTKVTVILKLQMATDRQIQDWKKAQKVSAGGIKIEGKRVLLVEDHPLNANIATRLLNAKGMMVERAENGQIGVEMFAKSAVDYYDAVLMDIRMPVMDGIEATKTIRKLARADARTVPIIAMTANAFEDDIKQTQAAGMNGHLSKPIQTEVLYATLAEKMRVPQFIQKQKILVVDDTEVNRVVIRATLEKDYEIIEAENGKQAAQILSKTKGVDAVITDIQMPEMDGIELIRWIRSDKKYRHMVIIANTQYGDPAQEELLLSLGANDFVYKPTTPTIVEIRVRNTLKRIGTR